MILGFHQKNVCIKKYNVIKFIPSILFESKNEEDWKKIIENNLNNRKNNIKQNNPLVRDKKKLISKIFQLKDNKLKYKNLLKKEIILYLRQLLLLLLQMNIKISSFF